MIRTASRRDQPTHRPRQMPSPEEVGQASIHLAASRLSGGAVVVHVQGEIDILTAPQFTREVVQVLDPAHNLLALDMAQVDFLGASGLSALWTFSTRSSRPADGCAWCSRPARCAGLWTSWASRAGSTSIRRCRSSSRRDRSAPPTS